MKLNVLMVAALMLTFSGCVTKQTSVSPNSQPSDLQTDTSALYQDWTRSFEEEKDPNDYTEMIFRPSDSRTFPVSRFRLRYNFNDNGSCSWLFLAPNDAHYMTSGTCDYPGNDDNLITISDSSGLIDQLAILELSDSILVLEK
jgi:hypothetical protein